MKNPGLKLVSLNGRNLTSDNINSPEWSLNPKLPVATPPSTLWVKKSLTCLFSTFVNVFISLKSYSPKSTSPNGTSCDVSDKNVPVKNTYNFASFLVVPSDWTLFCGLNATLKSTR